MNRGMELKKFKLQWMIITLNLLLCVSAVYGQYAEGTFSFSGSVNRFEDFTQEITPDLEFQLDYEADVDGWIIRIINPDQPNYDYTKIVTPPYRGTNALYIYEYHFQNEDGTWPNDGSENTPGAERTFWFVTDQETFESGFEALSAMLWPESDEAYENAVEIHNGIIRESGILHITDIELGSDEDGDDVWIERIEFEVELFLPQE
jgi:hypothetical protein